jgi:periplasmic protein TonB
MMPAGTVRRDVLRWGLCFAVVAAAHAAVALVLLRTPADADAEYVTGSAVEVVDLPQTSAPPPAPPPEAPGQEDHQVDEIPPPKEETKPPEQTAEVALPEPEPPHQEMPAQEGNPQPPPPPEVATVEAPSTAGVDEPQRPQPPSVSVLRWQSGLYAEIKRAARYPSTAHGRQGRIEIAVQIDRAGKVLESHIAISSGWSDLDQELLSMVVRAHLPKPPPDAKDADLQILVPMSFSK